MRQFHKLGTPKKGYLILGLGFPAHISRALIADGYTHYELEITDRGFLVLPRKVNGDEADDSLAVATLPDWSTA